ncbi:unnamed protein product [Clonostachys rosea]|uniref:Uncharacterized protein n=1 Tax=Bionectria ochroleuca TaxID=29856 RepID=A0ABY6UFQ0_BIOOC|nr:unnamed protein product [Clonostachys rosea]
MIRVFRVPHKQGISRETNESLADGSSKCGHEKTDRLDHGAHVLGRLGIGILERGDGTENLGESHENVGSRLYPNGYGSGRAGLARSVPATLGLSVDVILNNGGPEHGGRAGVETAGDLLDGGEADVQFTKRGVEALVADDDEQNERYGLQHKNDIVGDTVASQNGGLRDEIVAQLNVAEPEQGIPHEDAAGLEATAKLVDPSIIKGHPDGAVLW